MEVEVNGKKFPVNPHQSALDNQKGKPFVDDEDVALIRDERKCIGCGLCRIACLENNALGIPVPEEVEGCLYFRPDGKFHFSDSKCTRCGQCIMACPTGTLSEREHIEEVKKDLADPEKIVIAQTAPSMRVTIGEGFGAEPGKVMEGQMIAVLKKLGFDYVFDVSLGADFTTFEEAHDLIERVKNGGHLPLFTSCCPARVKYIEDFHPDLICNITTVRSPQQCLAVLIKTYFAKKIDKEPKDISVVSIMPCVAKKFEARRPGEDRSGSWDVDWVLTTREFIKLLKEKNIDPIKLKSEKFDDPLGEASGAGEIYGASGGVMESAVRTFAHLYNNQKVERIEYEEFRGMEGVKRAKLDIGGRELKIAIATGLANAKKVIDDLKDGIKYDYVEVMACPGGCVGGGGQPKPGSQEVINKRREALYQVDKHEKIRTAHENPIVKKIYEEFLGKPGGELAKKYLHTYYKKCQTKAGRLNE
jgi:NADH-quinone oxidoreductase subunit G/NADP-reducing hydrogenase subunit HndD